MAIPVSKPIYQIGLFLLAGVIIGLATPILFGFPAQWAFVVIVMVTMPCVAYISGNARLFILAGMVLMLPLRIDISFAREYAHQAGSTGITLSAANALLIVLYGLWFIEIIVSKEKGIVIYPKTTIPAIIYIEVALVSFTQAVKMNLATYELWAMIKAFFMYFYIVNNVRNIKEVKIIAWALAGTVAFESILAILQYSTGGALNLAFLGEMQHKELNDEDLQRVGGTLGHSNRLAMYLELLLPLCVTLFFWLKNTRVRIFAISAFISGFIALILTGSRGAWIAFFLTMSYLVITFVRKNLVNIQALVKPLLVIVLATAAVICSYWSYLENRVTSDDRGSAVGRIPMFEIAISVIEAHPILGVGLNNYAEVMQDYNDKVSAIRYQLRRPVHNIYLLITSETGILGLFAFLWFTFAFFSEGKKAIKLQVLPESMIATALTAGLFAFYIHGFVDKHTPGGSEIFYFLVGLLIAIGKLAEKQILDERGGNGTLSKDIDKTRKVKLIDQKRWKVMD